MENTGNMEKDQIDVSPRRTPRTRRKYELLLHMFCVPRVLSREMSVFLRVLRVLRGSGIA
jgi:hypothetical protein